MASEGDQKREKPRLFGVDLTLHYTNFSLHELPSTSYLAGETRANRQGDEEVPKLAASASKSTSTVQGPKARVFRCCYCSKKFYNSKALGGHQKAHRNELTASKLNSPPTDSFQYPPVVAQQQIFHRRLSHKFELQRVDLSNYRPHFEQSPPNLHEEFSSSSLSTVKRAGNDIELPSSSVSSLKGSFPSVKRPRNEDPRQHNTTENTEHAELELELDLSLHL